MSILIVTVAASSGVLKSNKIDGGDCDKIGVRRDISIIVSSRGYEEPELSPMSCATSCWLVSLESKNLSLDSVGLTLLMMLTGPMCGDFVGLFL